MAGGNVANRQKQNRQEFMMDAFGESHGAQRILLGGELGAFGIVEPLELLRRGAVNLWGTVGYF